MFVFRPELLLMTPSGDTPGLTSVGIAVTIAILGILPLAAAIAGYLWTPLSIITRGGLLLASACLLYPGQDDLLGFGISVVNLIGATLLGAVILTQWARRPGSLEPHRLEENHD
jgi:TRAP-type uncharacterized transport system fused permease subunit